VPLCDVIPNLASKHTTVALEVAAASQNSASKDTTAAIEDVTVSLWYISNIIFDVATPISK
jgi:hypothetical protein